MEKVCAEPEIDAGKRSGWLPNLDFGRVRSRKTGKKLPHDRHWGGREVKMGTNPSLERFQGQPIWEMSDDGLKQSIDWSCSRLHVGSASILRPSLGVINVVFEREPWSGLRMASEIVPFHSVGVDNCNLFSCCEVAFGGGSPAGREGVFRETLHGMP